MDGFNDLLTMLDYAINTDRKRHIVGGILISISLLFGGLAITVITLNKTEGEGYELQN